MPLEYIHVVASQNVVDRTKCPSILNHLFCALHGMYPYTCRPYIVHCICECCSTYMLRGPAGWPGMLHVGRGSFSSSTSNRFTQTELLYVYTYRKDFPWQATHRHIHVYIYCKCTHVYVHCTYTIVRQGYGVWESCLAREYWQYYQRQCESHDSGRVQ